MNFKDDNLQDRLLARLPQPGNADAYRKEVADLLAKNERGFRIEKYGAGAIWIFCVGLATAILLLGMDRTHDPVRAAWLGTVACVWLLFGAVELMKHFINRTRVELLKEVKQTQLQILELQELLVKRQ